MQSTRHVGNNIQAITLQSKRFKYFPLLQEKIEDAKAVFRSRIQRKDRQYNDQNNINNTIWLIPILL
jgi:hypothetical protein